MKIHIIGCSGSGKSYFAHELSTIYGIPHFDLDDIYWDNTIDNYKFLMPIDKRNELLDEILAHDSWIIEGVYYSWLKQSFDDADKIYVLEVPKYTCMLRIITRYIKRKLGVESGKEGNIYSLYKLLKFASDFQDKDLIKMRKLLKQYNSKVEWVSKVSENKFYIA